MNIEPRCEMQRAKAFRVYIHYIICSFAIAHACISPQSGFNVASCTATRQAGKTHLTQEHVCRTAVCSVTMQQRRR